MIIQDFMNKVVYKMILAGLLTTMFACNHKTQKSSNSEIEDIVDEGKVVSTVPQITEDRVIPNKETKTYTVTLITEGEKVKLDDTEFSLDGKSWQKSGEFQNLVSGKYIFYARNKRDKSLQTQRERYLEPFVDILLPTISQLNELLKQIAACDDNASDELRKYGKILPVHGVANVGNMEQLIRDACMNGVIYVVQKIETDTGGNLAAITILKN